MYRIDSRTGGKVYLPACRARVYGRGGQVIAELASVDDVVGERGALAPVLEIVRAGVFQVNFNGWFNPSACYWALRGLVCDHCGIPEDTR